MSSEAINIRHHTETKQLSISRGMRRIGSAVTSFFDDYRITPVFGGPVETPFANTISTAPIYAHSFGVDREAIIASPTGQIEDCAPHTFSVIKEQYGAANRN